MIYNFKSIIIYIYYTVYDHIYIYIINGFFPDYDDESKSCTQSVHIRIAGVSMDVHPPKICI